MYTIFVSSLNENMKLANVLKKQLNELDYEAEIINLVNLELPLYDSSKEQNGIPVVINKITETMEKSQGYIVISPEYNYSIPPILSNFIAWVSRSNDDFRKVFNEKFILLATHSGSGGTDVLNAMRNQFTKLGSIIMPREIITTYEKALEFDSSKKILQQFIKFAR
ncbi:NADPH-dependent FMN reductase [Sulfurospirillum arcachonense]|uniref:NADPH-dependent FMN reductase n=1 Tax=Sulfurospirillum arcachonense TaxID=57666 RepID=UPI0004696A67|nr:NAD(P)H-dependent oxidoreductase [Sulfurospirillum arcachonense]